MLKRKKMKTDLYSNQISQFIDMVKPQNLYLVGGRGLSKTVDIMTKRTLDANDTMPQAIFGFVGETYIKVMTDIIPKILGSWEDRFNFKEGRDFVIDDKPPESWPKPVLIRMKEFKHSISTSKGCLYLIKSLDRPSAAAGTDMYHLFGDEAKYFKREKMKKQTPALRGNSLLFKDSHMFMGHTFTTDMPNPADPGEDEWILDMEKNMDIRQILDIYYLADVCNNYMIQIIEAEEKDDKEKGKKLYEELKQWNERLLKRRRNSTLFLLASSLANVDILTFDYIINQFKTLEYEEFLSAILSFKTSLNKAQRFYALFSEKNTYTDGYNYDYFNARGIRENMQQNCNGLRYINTKKPLEAGADFGNMMSMVIGQFEGNTGRVLKNMFTLTPEWIPQLGKKFREFFAPHEMKLLYLRYDRAANNYQKAGADMATQLKRAIEFDEKGVRSGWNVILESLGQANVSHEQDFNLSNVLFGKQDHNLPEILIDAYECKELCASLRLAPKVPGKEIKKEKKTEKYAIHRLPMESTNMSDAFKYFICKKQFIRILKNRRPIIPS
jgi:hypothetical protein